SDSSTLIGAHQPPTVHAPEIEAGVGCDFDSYLLMPDTTLDDRIAAAKARLGRDVVILGHHYQRDEVVKFADFRGDSLKLSFQASQAEGREKVLFLPDEHLGRNTGYPMGIPLDQMIVWDPYQDFGGNTPEAIRNARVILWKGYCSVHQRFTSQQVDRVRRQHPGIRVIV